MLAILVVAVILLVALTVPRLRDFERYLEGFWVGDSAFMREAGLTELYLYLSPPEKSGGGVRRQGYLLMGGSGRVLSNQSLELTYSDLAGRAWSALDGNATYRIRGVAIQYDETAVLPETLDLVLNPARGTLALNIGEKACLEAYKDNETSNYTNTVLRAEPEAGLPAAKPPKAAGGRPPQGSSAPI